MPVFLETERLALRAFTDDDVDHVFALDNDPDVMRFINGGKPGDWPESIPGSEHGEVEYELTRSEWEQSR